MPTLREWLRALPADEPVTHRAGTLLKLIEEDRCAKGHRQILTTDEAVAMHGYSKPTWAKWAAEGKLWAHVDGERVEAWQDGDGGPWRLPREAVAAHISRLRERATTGRKGARIGPRKNRRPETAR